jgi:hypothetical protein
MPKPTEAADVRIAAADVRLYYQGSVFLLTPLSPAGQEWLANTIPDQPPGPVRVPLRYLDQVLSIAQRARLRLDVPWDQADAD